MIGEFKSGSGYPNRDFHVESPNLEADRRTERLREAVKRAGKAPAVAARAGIPYGTLNKYLAGRDMPTANLVALAHACEVTIEWLATGNASMSRAAPDPGISPSPGTSQPLTMKLFGTVDMDRMGAAIEGAQRAFSQRGVRPSSRRLAQVAMLLYDAIGEPGVEADRIVGDENPS